MDASRIPDDLDPDLKDLIRRKVPRLLRCARDGSQDSDDIEQELVVRYLAKLERSVRCAEFPNRTLNQVASNVLRASRTRKRRGGRPSSLQELVRDFADGLAVVADLLTDDRRRAQRSADADVQIDLREAISRLPRDLRAVAERLQLGKSAAQIAADLGVKRATAYRRIGRAVEALRERFFPNS